MFFIFEYRFYSFIFTCHREIVINKSRKPGNFINQILINIGAIT